jgi:hypothetical protein
MRALLRHAKPLGYFATSTAWRVADRLHLAPPRPPVAMVIERAEWAIRWYGSFIVDEVNKLQPGTAWATPDPARLTSGVVQFGSQYQWVVWNRYLSPRCRNVVSFMHGKPEDGDEAWHAMSRQFIKHRCRSIARVVCTAARVVDGAFTRLVGRARASKPRATSRSACDRTGMFKPATPDDRQAAMRRRYGIEDRPCSASDRSRRTAQGWGDGDDPKLIKGPDMSARRCRQAAPARVRPVFVLLTGPARGYREEAAWPSSACPSRMTGYDELSRRTRAQRYRCRSTSTSTPRVRKAAPRR